MADNNNFLISDITVIVNNVPFAMVADSGSLNPGLGEQKMMSASLGAGNVVVVYGQDAKTLVSIFKCELYTTQANVNVMKDWKAAFNTLSVQVMHQQTGTLFHINNAALTNLLDFKFSATGTIEVEFQGDPAIY